MMTHHDSRDYNTAASEAAAQARTIMEKKIAEGRVSASALVERINTQITQDAIAKARAISFAPDAVVASDNVKPVVRMMVGKGSAQSIHKHALGQMAAKVGIPGQYLGQLATSSDEWQRNLAAEILNKHFHEGQPLDRFLVRSVAGEVRGVLSDRYRRLDNRPLLEAFAGECQKIGAVPVDGTFSDTRITLKAFLPMVFEPVPNEVMCLGVEWGNSDFGAARHTVRAMIWRLWCTNKATMEDTLAQVHLGAVMPDSIELSQRTYDYDTKTSVSALRDIVRGVLAPKKVNALLATIKSADENKIQWKSAKSLLAKKLLKGEMQKVEDAFTSDDVQNLPAGESTWRLSNAISWIAGSTEDADRKLELQRLAGQVVNGRVDKELAAA